MDEFIAYDEVLEACRKIDNSISDNVWELYEVLGYIHEGRILNDVEMIDFKIKCKKDRLFIALSKEYSMAKNNNLCICKNKHVKHFHYIKHVKTGMVLVVGSTCIKQFMNKIDIDIIIIKSLGVAT